VHGLENINLQHGPVGIVGNYFLLLLANQTRCKHMNWLVEAANWMWKKTLKADRRFTCYCAREINEQ